MDDLEIVKEFLVESLENMDRLDQDLIALEKAPTNKQLLGSIFRTIHTIKGSSGFLAFHQLESLTHAGESLLACLRDGVLTITPEIATALLAMVDAVRQILADIEKTGKEGARDDRDLIATLTRLQAREQETRPDLAISPGDEKQSVAAHDSERLTCDDKPHVELHPGAPTERSPAAQPEGRLQSAGDSTIRVDVSLLDQLMNLVGELVLTRNQILQVTTVVEESALLSASQRLNLITTELQEAVMKTRMQPIGNIWNNFPRMVRDVALGCGKQVQIEMDGKETELDKKIIEAIKDPLTHLVRNAVDHGIELPDARKKGGKSPQGRLSLRAFHEGGQVNIEITDDGQGLDLARIRSAAIEKGLVSTDVAGRLTEREATNLVFLPGLSTAEKVTNISGRGVGMDVVKTNIEKIGGTVDIQTRPGHGTTVRMKIPLTLAIIPALIVTSAGDRYAIPQVSLLELVHLEGEGARKGIEKIQGAPVYRLRGKLLPIVYLNRELKVGNDSESQYGSAIDLDFAAARGDHQRWLQTLSHDAGNLSPQDPEAYRRCAVGKWLYDAGLRRFGQFAEIVALEQAHREFHRLIRQIVALKHQGNSAQASQEMIQVRRGSDELLQLLSKVEQRTVELQNVNIVILQADDRHFGLVVDEVNDTEEIVVKPLDKQLKSINAYAGATIMGDGKVALILDVMGMAQRANVISEVRDRSIAEKGENGIGAASETARKNPVLLFQNGEKGRMAVDLSLVARLEEFPASAIETAAGQEVVQYRGQIMPLVRVSDLRMRPNREAAEQESIQVIVHTANETSVGLVVDRILDIVDTPLEIQRHTRRKGVLGSAVIQKHVTDILDVPGLIAAADPGPSMTKVGA